MFLGQGKPYFVLVFLLNILVGSEITFHLFLSATILHFTKFVANSMQITVMIYGYYSMIIWRYDLLLPW